MESERTTNDEQPSGAGDGRTLHCPACAGTMRFAGGEATHDLYAERYVCESCGHVAYRSFGRGSVS